MSGNKIIHNLCKIILLKTQLAKAYKINNDIKPKKFKFDNFNNFNNFNNDDDLFNLLLYLKFINKK